MVRRSFYWGEKNGTSKREDASAKPQKTPPHTQKTNKKKQTKQKKTPQRKRVEFKGKKETWGTD